MQSKHLVALDGYRGIASIAVLCFHIFLPLHILVAPRGYLAVDFFFLLSGFVIDRAYGNRLSSIREVGAFFKLRFIRLYPMILAGVLMGAVVSIGKPSLWGIDRAREVAAALMFALLLLPGGTLSTSGFMLPLNGPMWSLFYEVVANILYAFCARFLNPPILVGITFLSLVLLVETAILNDDLQMGSGSKPIDYFGGMARIGFSFCLGVLIQRSEWVRQMTACPWWIAPVALTSILFVPYASKGHVFDIVCVAVVFPAILIAGLNQSKLPAVAGIAFKFLGDLSYPLYTVHYPILRGFLYFQEKLTGLALAASIVAEVILCVTAAFLMLKLYDEPVRNWLGQSRRYSTQKGMADG